MKYRVNAAASYIRTSVDSALFNGDILDAFMEAKVHVEG